jgi:hypothetical protein
VWGNPYGVEGNMQSSLSGFTLVVTGSAVMLVAAVMDFIYARNNGFGFQQLSILIAGLIVALAGVRSLVYPRRKTWDGVLLIVYFAGILFMGLKPSCLAGQATWINGVLGIDIFSRSDFAINMLGFIPLGYLLMSCLDVESDTKSRRRTLLSVLCFGLGLSLGLEILQHSIPGRYSSLYDLLANGLGTMTGIAFHVTGRLWGSLAHRIG